jgi:uncharacterized protein YjeT (DUF2065 family)
METLVSLIGLRAGVVGMSLALAPRWFRRVTAEFLKLSDNELRVIGYVLLGSALSVFAHRATTQALTARLDELTKGQRALPAT